MALPDLRGTILQFIQLARAPRVAKVSPMNATHPPAASEIPADNCTLPAALELPAKPPNLIEFAHGLTSSNPSPRNILVARSLLELIHGANHLFAEPGKLDQVASLSFRWFQTPLARCA